MKKYVINGGRPLKGTVKISGSKNAALPVMAASLLTNEDVILKNIPLLKDTQTMISLLAKLGKNVVFESDRIIIRTTSHKHKATYDIVKQMRASIVVLGPLLAKYGKAVVSLPGGCVFGPRPVDLHLKGLEALSASIEMHHGDIYAQAKRLRGGTFSMMGEFGTSVLGTDNVVMAASLADGVTRLENAAREPETEDLIRMLQTMGAKIRGAGTTTLTIEGVEKLHGCEFTVIPDRIEAATFIVAAAVTGGVVEVHYTHIEHIKAFLDVLKECGVGIKVKDGCVKVSGKKNLRYKPFTVTTFPYPGFPTDMQALIMPLGMVSPGVSSITENVYPNRFNHVPELVRLGADIILEKNTAIIKEPGKLEGANIQGSDLRAAAALVVAALAVEGTSEVRRVYHLERGYENFVSKLKNLGASVREARDKII